MKSNTKLKVRLTFEWEITPKEWNEAYDFSDDYMKEMENKITYDPAWAFWVLNNIRWPSLAEYKIEKVN